MEGSPMITQYQDRTFDRVPHWDDRNARFLISREEHPESVILGQKRKTRNWTLKSILNQGRLGSCVGNGCAGFCSCTPKPQPDMDNEEAAVRVYHEAQDLDEWPGHNYEGTSLLGGMKALVKEKRITKYLWLKSTDEIALAIGYISPVVIAIDWQGNMMDTDSDGFIHYSGGSAGGHCVCVSGYDDKKRAFKIAQSWGTGWGLDGYCYISEEDLGLALTNQGECALPTKVAKV